MQMPTLSVLLERFQRTRQPNRNRYAITDAGATPATAAPVVHHRKRHPRRSTIVRFATLTAIIAFLTTLGVAKQYPNIDRHHDREAVTAILLVATGFLGLAILRGDQDEMATSLLFSLRILATLPVVAAIGAALIVALQLGQAQAMLWCITGFVGVCGLLLGRNWYVASSVARARPNRF